MNIQDDISLSSHQTRTSQRTGSDKYPGVITTGQQDGDAELGKEDNAAVLRARMVLFKVMFLSALALSLGTYTHISNKEKQAFEEAFRFQSTRLRDAIGDEFARLLSTADSFITSSISATESLGKQEWPFVVIPDYATRAAKILPLTPTFQLSMFPLVKSNQYDDWIEFANEKDAWVDESIIIQNKDKNFAGQNVTEWTKPAAIVLSNASDFAMPTWQIYPIVPSTLGAYGIDANLLAPAEISEVLRTNHVVVGRTLNIDQADRILTQWAEGIQGKDFPASEPLGVFYSPINKNSNQYVQSDDTVANSTVALLSGTFFWRTLLEGHLPSDAVGLVIVIETSCGGAFTYRVDGTKATYLGMGRAHETLYTESLSTSLSTLLASSVLGSTYSGTELSSSFCPYKFTFYASSVMRDEFMTNEPITFTLAVIAMFVFTSMIFVFYDYRVERRQKHILRTATQSSAIVSSLFPSNVRDRLYAEREQTTGFIDRKQKLRNFLAGENIDMQEEVEDTAEYAYGSKPIADLFPATSIIFADLVGFTAWSSTREPSQVFQLLESIFKEFDEIAKRRRIFKVETVGDCYVAVVGLPDPRKDHAVAMARFAFDCMSKFNLLLPKLEIVLGPDTADLAIRMGIHSGSVTAGVLRGERSRFQLFGDTMNTASRMESTSQPSRIQVSEETAKLLMEAKKTDWVTAREGTVSVKGKGEMKTYWLSHPNAGTQSSCGESVTNDEIRTVDEFATIDLPHVQKTDRLIKWNVEIMLRLLKKIHNGLGLKPSSRCVDDSHHIVQDRLINEAVEVIRLPKYQKIDARNKDKPLGKEVEEELTIFVSQIASMYRNDCPFHCFEHASHVVMSVSKLLGRIVAPSDLQVENGDAMDSVLHDSTFGITSDPLTQFSVVFSALIHDAGHVGVPNTQLAKENPRLVKLYGNKSLAEQNSINVAWELLMESRFANLRSAIYHTAEEKVRFKQLVVNSVLATDIVDKELKALRNGRWQKAFDSKALDPDNVHRKATIVIEHLIQASDVAHTMQHWIVFRKWNERLFAEMYKAFVEGRSAKDPSEFWYEGELGFFDFYIIPLAKKLKDCGVFGVSSDEYLQYAMRNREEWELKGQSVVSSMKERAIQSLHLTEESDGKLDETFDNEEGVEVRVDI